ncbi:MAG TPA: UvrD-helicase domain-containing protein, partial [Candidatus Anaerobutyricum stercoripullorum]|nr:UvrD-helicase domain-containing protein [Candidatus Anaerobutyricum stercoripullorum]
MNFTKEQEQAVRLRDCDILVSAGAGAGKTRVLVSRMAEMILDEEHPLSVNDFLVMTFTNAAAEEMRERITAELDLRLEKEPQNRRLRRQVRLMKHADISTVHSFCNRLIRTHFNEAGIDPSFRIGEEGELFLLRQKAMEDVLEEAYESGRESFRRFVEAYAPGKNDRMIENLIEEMYRFSRGFPDRDQWLIAVREEERLLESPETVTKSRAFLTLSARVRGVLEALLAEVEAGLDLFCGAPESERFDALLTEDAEKIQALLEEEDFDALCEAFAGLKLANLPRANKKEKEWPYLEEAQALHKTVREELQQIRQDYFLYDLRELCRENRELSGCFEELITLSGRYEELYFQSKKDRNVYDFDDLEHIALSLLVESYGEDGQPTPSAVAKELSEKYKAVFVDEYQDTNLVQETILNTICREGNNNLFVVGDVKQSIYRFRQARPDLFLSRYDRYHKTEEAAAGGLPTESQENPAAGQPAGVRVELRDNFRSVPGVLGLCNLVFSRLMDRQFGGVDYTEDIALRPGKGGPMEQEKEESEMLLLIEDAEKDNLAMEVHSVEAETAMIARRIRGLLEEGYGYGDMVILLRSDAGRAEVMAEFLTAAGIPAVCESRTGYFQTREVQLVLNYLAIVDNVYQDIPMASVLLSSIGGLTEEELARLRVLTSAPTRQEYAFFDLIEIYLAEGKDEGLREKLDRFVEQLLYFRRKKKEMPL